MKHIFVVIFFIGAIFASESFAKETFSSEDMSSLNEDVAIQPSSGKQIKQQIRNWFNEKNVVPRIASKSNKTYYSGTSVVNVSVSDRNYPKALQQAFEAAFDQARADFVFDRVGDQFSDKNVELYENGSSNARDFSPEMCKKSQLDAIWNKIIALANAQLDKELEEFGIDPAEFKATPKTARKDLFYEKSIETLVKTSSGEIVGLLPVQTFLATAQDGTSSVGVIMVYSPKLMSLVDDLKSGNPPNFSSKRAGKPMSYFANKNVDDLEATFGPRLVFNEDGQPMVLSYGQWGASYTGNSARQKERSRNLAFEKADMQAMQLIGEFVNGKLESRSEQISGSIIEHYIESDCTKQREKENETIIDEMSKYMRIRGNANAKGSVVIREWSKVNEYGVEIIGSIRAYSFDIYQQHTKSLEKGAAVGQTIKNRIKKSVEDSDPEEDW